VRSFLADARFALRGLRRSPGFTAVAVLTLALGMGATSAIFTVVDGVLLRPLPYRDPDRIVTVLHGGNGPVAPANYLDWRAGSRSFASTAAAQAWGTTLTGRGPAESIAPALQVTADLFAVLGVPAALGRTFRPGEDQPGAARTVVLGHRLWQRLFAADPQIVGQTLVLDGTPHQVIGVMPAGFEFAPFWVRNAELWAPLDLGARRQDRNGESLRVFARLAPGVSRAEAQAETTALWQRLARQYPGDTRADVVIGSLHDKAVGKVRRPLLVLLAGVGFVLLIACANVANLLLARAAGRRKEMGIRTSLGAGRGRLVRQLLTESLVLALAGGALGLLLAHTGVQVLLALGPRDLPRLESIALDGRVLAFSAAVCLGTGLVFGLAPALAISRDLQGSLRDGGRGATEGIGRHRARGLLVVSEMALAMVLLIGAGLMIRSFARLRAVDPGFDPRGVISVSVPQPSLGDPLTPLTPELRLQRAAQRRDFARVLLARMRALGGVASAGGINHLPISGDLWMRELAVEGAPAPAHGEEPRAIYRVITPGYIPTLGLTLLEGRDLTERDDQGAPGAVIVNETLARRLWPGQDPLGRQLRVEDGGPNPRTVVGLVRDVKQREWTAPAGPEMYLAYLQNPSSSLTLVVRAAGAPLALAPAIQQEIAAVDPRLPAARPRLMEAVVADAVGQPRFNLLLLDVFAGIALLLAAVGIYGVMAYAVSRRRQELGIRLALGARRGQILTLVLSDGMRLAAAGVAVGLLAALALTRMMGALLYEVSATDPATFAALAVVLTSAALLACYLPARRATSIDPMTALRQE
jgi:predicted permease